jgi:hypothetical protein
MSAQNLPSFPFAGFAQLIPALLEQEIKEVNRLLQVCDWSDVYASCREKAVVHHLDSEADLCLHHFQTLNQGEL